MGAQQSCVNCFSQTCPSSVAKDFTEFCGDGKSTDRRSQRSNQKPPIVARTGSSSTAEPQSKDDLGASLLSAPSTMASSQESVPPDEPEYDNNDNDRNNEFIPDPDQGYDTQRDPEEEAREASRNNNEEEETGPKAPFSLDTIVGDLALCEQKFYKGLFGMFDDESKGKVSADHMLLRESLMHYSSLTEDLMSSKLQEHVDYQGDISFNSFLELVRNNAADESIVMVKFYQTGDGQDLSPAECQDALTLFGMEELNAEYQAAEWHIILDFVMGERSLSGVDMFQMRCQILARIIRLHRAQ